MSDNLRDFKVIAPKPLREEIASILRKAILSGELEPEERLIETELAEKMGISRMPIREALRMLENEGLVKHVPRKGLLVTKFTEQDVREIYAIREALEVYAIALVIDNISNSELKELENHCSKSEEAARTKNYENLYIELEHFNTKLYLPCHMERMIKDIYKSQAYLQSFRVKSMRLTERCSQAIEEHWQILKAIREKDKEKATKLIRKHLQSSLKAYLKSTSLKK